MDHFCGKTEGSVSFSDRDILMRNIQKYTRDFSGKGWYSHKMVKKTVYYIETGHLKTKNDEVSVW